MGTFNSLLINKQMQIQAPVEDVMKKLLQGEPDGFSITSTDNNEFRFLADFSLGTMYIRGMPNLVPGINILGTLNEAGNGVSSLKIRSPLRIELVSVFLICAIVIYAAAFNTTNSTSIYLYFLMPALVIGLWLIYRVQESRLLKKVAEFLRAK